MTDRITVSVVEFSDRKHYQLQWKDPITGRKRTQSSGIERTGRQRDRDKAAKKAGALREKLESGQCVTPTRIKWDAFRERYEREHLASLAEGTRGKVSSVLNTLERVLNPSHLRSITAERLSHYQAVLREKGRSENTIAGHVSHIRAALGWAADLGLLPKVPKLKRPRRAKSGKMMKGRAISGEEFERLLDAVAAGLMAQSKRTHKKKPGQKRKPPQKRTRPKRARKAPPAEVVAAWKQYLRGLWFSGLRLGESLELSWDDSAGLWVDLSGKFPVMRIRAESEKGHEDRMLAICPDFAAFLTSIPESERSGRVFKLPCRRGDDRQLDMQYVSAIVSQIGREARVVVDRDPRTDKPKFASAHDLRRSFGERWARKVMPVVLQELMRHESIETTLKFYVRSNAELTAQAVWESCGATWKGASVSREPVHPNAASPSVAPSTEGEREAVE